jgi:hypothetical protein
MHWNTTSSHLFTSFLIHHLLPGALSAERIADDGGETPRQRRDASRLIDHTKLFAEGPKSPQSKLVIQESTFMLQANRDFSNGPAPGGTQKQTLRQCARAQASRSSGVLRKGRNGNTCNYLHFACN